MTADGLHVDRSPAVGEVNAAVAADSLDLHIEGVGNAQPLDNGILTEHSLDVVLCGSMPALGDSTRVLDQRVASALGDVDQLIFRCGHRSPLIDYTSPQVGR